MSSQHRTARVSVRVRPAAISLLRRMARVSKKTLAQYVRDALSDRVTDDLRMLEIAKGMVAKTPRA